jgi:hypothetical protein
MSLRFEQPYHASSDSILDIAAALQPPRNEPSEVPINLLIEGTINYCR